jgi:FkbM family methyltransferase
MYLKMVNFQPTDTWVDLGGNIGAFAVPIAQFCEKVVSFEPVPENHQLMCFNIAINSLQDKISVFETAVTGGLPTDESVSFYEANKKQRGSSTLRPTRGRTEITVKTTNINDVIEKVLLDGAQHLKLKVDIEGAEHDVIWHLKPELLAHVEEVVMEYHPKMIPDPTRQLYEEVCSKLKAAGMVNITRSGSDSDRSWMGWPFLLHAVRPS